MGESFSVVVPARACGPGLRQAIDSVSCQLGADDEVIIAGIAEDAARMEAALSDANCGRMGARVAIAPRRGRAAALAAAAPVASGTRVIMLDEGSVLGGGALRELSGALAGHDADVVHFRTAVRDPRGRDVSPAEPSGDAELERACPLAGDEVFLARFVERRLEWGLDDTCLRASLCREACGMLALGPSCRESDVSLSLLLAWLAESYVDLPGAPLVSHGSLGARPSLLLSLDEFRGVCASSVAVAPRKTASVADGSFGGGLRETRRWLAWACADAMRDRLARSDLGEGLAILVDSWGCASAVDALSRAFGSDLPTLARSLGFAGSPQLHPGDTIASYYHTFSGGGAQNVQRMLVRVWQRLGLHVVLLLDVEPDADAVAELGVAYRVLPQPDPSDRRPRAEALGRCIDELGIRGIVHHAFFDEGLFWDLLVFKLRGLAFHIVCHNTCAAALSFAGLRLFASMPAVSRHADSLVVLSEADASFWRSFHPRVFVTVNPCSLPVLPSGVSPVPRQRRVLWLGRLSPEKCPDQAFDIFARLLELVGDATLDFVGSAVDEAYGQRVLRRAEELGISHAVNMVGWSDDAGGYFDRARVFLGTAYREGYPLTLGESQARGVPCVMYDLPYLTLVREGGGIATVPFGDIDAAARELARVLEDDALWTRMHDAALSSAARFGQFDFEALWREILMSDARPAKAVDGESVSLAHGSIVSSCEQGAAAIEGQIAQLERHVAQAAEENRRLARQLAGLGDENRQLSGRIDDLHRSNSWRIGRAVTFLPRLTKRLLARVR